MRTATALLCLLISRAAAGELVFLGINEQGAEEWYRIVDGATVIRICGGEFMRRPYERRGTTEEPRPQVVDSCFMDKWEVTNRQFARFLNAAKSVQGLVVASVPGLVFSEGRWSAAPGLGRHPVTAATGAGALAYASWIDGRVPSAAEWEKAAGGTKGSVYPWGDAEPTPAHANFGRPRPRGPMPVGSFRAGASPYGCLDMAGNVYERVMTATRDGHELPVMVKGGSWLSPHPMNLRVLDLCMQPMEVAERSVGFRCAMKDPEPERPVRAPAPTRPLELALSWEEAVKEAKRRRVPIFLSLHFDTCGQCDRTREQCFKDPRFVAYCNEHIVVAVGQRPGDAAENPHPPNADDSCPLHAGLECWQHEAIFNKAIEVVEQFRMSPGNFVLHPDRCERGAGGKAMLVRELELPKWGNAVEEYIAAFERARKSMAE
ncbi:MAG: SUMF1/EgtB/PvdO family nonheme iron enzyme [Planctomycetota bacterium]|jgi:formylglycine-generating enzyme required for sulfatase activity